MANQKRLSGIALFFAAFILLLVASVSVPFFKTVDIVHTTVSVEGVQFQDVRYGIWGTCGLRIVGTNGNPCQYLGHGYAVDRIIESEIPGQITLAVGVESSWTRGLILHPIATALVFITFVNSIVVPNQRTVIITGFIGALLILVALAIDIAFNVLTRNAVNQITSFASTSFGPGFYLTLVGFVATVAGVILIFIHSRSKDNA